MDSLLISFGIDWRLLIINSVNFFVLLGALSYFLYAPMMRMLEERRQKIIRGMEDADSASARLAEIEEARAGMLAQAGQDADEVLSRARTAALRREKESQVAAEATVARVAQQAAAEAHELKERALSESKQEIAKLIILGTEKLMKEKVGV